MRQQVVMTAPTKIVVGKYLTAKGLRLKREGAKKEQLEKYTKNRVVLNPLSKPFRERAKNDQGKQKTRVISHIK